MSNDVSISRHSRSLTATFAVSSTLSPALDVRAFERGLLRIPSPWGGGTCTFKTAVSAGGSYGVLRDSAGAVVSLNPTAAAVHQLHAAVLNAHYLKIVKAIAVTGTRQIGLDLKA